MCYQMQYSAHISSVIETYSTGIITAGNVAQYRAGSAWVRKFDNPCANKMNQLPITM